MSTIELYIIICSISAIIGGTIGYIRKKRQNSEQEQANWLRNKMLELAIANAGTSEYIALVSSVGREKANDIVLMNWKLKNGYFGV